MKHYKLIIFFFFVNTWTSIAIWLNMQNYQTTFFYVYQYFEKEWICVEPDFEYYVTAS